MESGPCEIALAGGFCAYEPTGITPIGIAIISMGGPVASLAGTAATALLWSRTHGLVRDAMSVATVGGAIAGIVNALPLPLTFSGRHRARRAARWIARIRGAQASACLGSGPSAGDVKAGPVAERWALEVEDAGQRARAVRAHTNVARLRAREAERQARSVPPPGL